MRVFWLLLHEQQVCVQQLGKRSLLGLTPMS